MLAVRSEDPVLNWVGAAGLAHSVRTALIVDLVGAATTRTLADIVADGPKLAEISPGRTGVARISAGMTDLETVRSAAQALATNWPAVVVALDRDDWDGALVPYRGIYPGVLAGSSGTVAVWQPVSRARPTSRLPGPVLPPLAARGVRAMLSGRRPRARRWIGAWGHVWDMPWG